MADETTVATDQTAKAEVAEPGPGAKAAVAGMSEQQVAEGRAKVRSALEAARARTGDPLPAKAEEAADKQQPEPAKKPEAKPEPPTLTQRQREAATQFGYSDKDVAELGDKAPAVLQKLADRWDRQTTELDKAAKAKAAAEKGKEEAAGKEAGDDTETAGDHDGQTVARNERGQFSRTKPPTVEEFLGVDGDGYSDPETAKPAFKWLVDQVKDMGHVREEVAALVGKLGEVAAFIEGTRLDQFWAKIPVDLIGTYGQGSTSDLPADSPERKQRDRAAKLMRDVRNQRLQDGQDADMLDVLGEIVQAATTTTNRRAAGSYNPSGRMPPERTADPTAQAKAELKRKLAQARAAAGVV